jgi:hypothetical protein
MAVRTLLSCLALFFVAFVSFGELGDAAKPPRALNCSAAPSSRTYHRPSNSTHSLMYISARFRIGEKRRWSEELSSFGCHVVNSGVFQANEVRILGDELPSYLSSSDTFDRHRVYLTNTSDASSRGAGYWFWKPLVVLHNTRKDDVKNGTFVVYSDLDRPDVVGYVGDLIETMLRRGHDFAIQQWKGGAEAVHTKGDTFQRFGVYKHVNDPKSKLSRTPQYSANFFILQKNERTSRFIGEWAALMRNYHLVSDEPSVLPNDKAFVENRHDQSMLSMLLKTKYQDGSKTAVALNFSNIPAKGDANYVSQLDTFTFKLLSY